MVNKIDSKIEFYGYFWIVVLYNLVQSVESINQGTFSKNHFYHFSKVGPGFAGIILIMCIGFAIMKTRSQVQKMTELNPQIINKETEAQKKGQLILIFGLLVSLSVIIVHFQFINVTPKNVMWMVTFIMVHMVAMAVPLTLFDTNNNLKKFLLKKFNHY